MSKWIQPGHRLMDRAYLRDGDILYTGEQLVLALLLHTKGRSKRDSSEVQQVVKLLDDPKAIPRKRK